MLLKRSFHLFFSEIVQDFDESFMRIWFVLAEIRYGITKRDVKITLKSLNE